MTFEVPECLFCPVQEAVGSSVLGASWVFKESSKAVLISGDAS